MAGVVGCDPGMGGNDSISDAPKFEDGLNAFKPAKPVTWDFTGSFVEKDVLVVPVAWLERAEENSEFEKAELEAEVVFVAEVS